MQSLMVGHERQAGWALGSRAHEAAGPCALHPGSYAPTGKHGR